MREKRKIMPKPPHRVLLLRLLIEAVRLHDRHGADVGVRGVGRQDRGRVGELLRVGAVADGLVDEPRPEAPNWSQRRIPSTEWHPISVGSK